MSEGKLSAGGAAARVSSSSTLWVFAAWLAIFYSSWLFLVARFGLWEEVQAHWPIAAAMAAGSYFAGSTPMGGGTVGFPFLVLLLDQPASLGRHFAFAVQSVGMVSASIYILAARRPVDWAILRPALIAALVSTPLSCAFIAPYASDMLAKLTFATLWASFGLLHFYKLRAIIAPEGPRAPEPGLDRNAGIFIGVAGGVVASITGVGIDMLLYAALVLYFRSDIKIAIPTSVVLMAFTSLVGILTSVALSRAAPSAYPMSPEVFYNWLAAAPVVAVGAPFGALVVNRLPRAPTLLIVSALCIGQYVWTLWEGRLGPLLVLTSLAALGALCGFFLFLYRMGESHSGEG